MSVDVGALTARRNLLRQTVHSCERCPLGGQGNNVGFYGAVHYPKLLIVGEAPGENEVIQGKPFTGRAGKLLWSELARHKVSRSEVFTLNTVACRPTTFIDGRVKNRAPLQSEVDACHPLFVMQVGLVSHCRFVLALGNTALHKFRPDAKIGDWNGKPLYIERGGKPALIIMPCYHPAAILRDPNLHDEFSSAIDLLVAMVNLGDAFMDIWPVTCSSCGSDEVFHFSDTGRGWCGPCYTAEFQLPIPGVPKAQPTKLKTGQRGEVSAPKRKPTRRVR